jgi:hypothetical protein
MVQNAISRLPSWIEIADAGTKMLTITPSMTVNDQTFSQSTPSSGTYRLLPNSSAINSYSLSFGAITNGSPGEVVQQIGVAILSRNADTSYPFSLTVTADLASGGTQPLTALIPMASGQNVFFGFTAPANDSISGLSFSGPAGSGDPRTIIDDLGFITSVPEPASLGLFAIGAMGLLGRRRRRR